MKKIIRFELSFQEVIDAIVNSLPKQYVGEYFTVEMLPDGGAIATKDATGDFKKGTK